MPKQPKIQRRPRLVFDVDDTLCNKTTGEYNDPALEAARKLGYGEVDFCTASIFGSNRPDNSKAEIAFPKDEAINDYATGNATRLKVKKHVAKKGLSVAAVVTTASHLVESELGAYYREQVEPVEQIAVDYYKNEKAKKKKNPRAAKEELHFNADPRVVLEAELLAIDTIAHDAYRLDCEWMKNKIQYDFQAQYFQKLNNLLHDFFQKEGILIEIQKQLEEKKVELEQKRKAKEKADAGAKVGDQEQKALASKLLEEVNILQWQIEVLEKEISDLKGVADVNALSELIQKVRINLGTIKQELKDKLQNSAKKKRARNNRAHEKTDKPGNFYEGLLHFDDPTTYPDDGKEFMLRGIMSLLPSHENMIMVDDRGAVLQRVADMNTGKGLYTQPCELLVSGSDPQCIDSQIQIILSLQDKNCTIRFPLPFVFEGENKRSFFQSIEEQNKSILPYTYQFTDEEWKALKIKDTTPGTLARVQPQIIQILSRKAQIPPKCEGRMHGVLACMSNSDEEARQDEQYYLRQFIQGYSLPQLGYLLDDKMPAGGELAKSRLKEWINTKPLVFPKDLLARLVLAMVVVVSPQDGQNLYEIAKQISELASKGEFSLLKDQLIPMFVTRLHYLNPAEKADFAWACHCGGIEMFCPEIIKGVNLACKKELIIGLVQEVKIDDREIHREKEVVGGEEEVVVVEGEEEGKGEKEEEVLPEAIPNVTYSLAPEIFMQLLIESICSSQEKSIQIREMRRFVRLIATMNSESLNGDFEKLQGLAPNILFAGLVYCIAEKEKQQKAYKDRKQKAEKANQPFTEEEPSLALLTQLQALCAEHYLQGAHQWGDLNENLEAMKKLDTPVDMPPLTSFYEKAQQLAKSQRSVPYILWSSQSEPVLNGEQQIALLNFMACKLRVALEPEYLQEYVGKATEIIRILEQIPEAKPFIRQLSQDIASAIWKEKDPETQKRLFHAYLPETKDLDFRWLYLIQSFSKLDSQDKVLPEVLVSAIDRLISGLSESETVTEDDLRLIQDEIRSNLWNLVGQSQDIYNHFAHWFILNQASTTDPVALRRFVQITSYCLGLANISEDRGFKLFWQKLQDLSAPFSEEERQLIRFAGAKALGNNKVLVPTTKREACTELKLLDSNAEFNCASSSAITLKEDGQYRLVDRNGVEQTGTLKLDGQFIALLKAFKKLEGLDAQALHQKFIGLKQSSGEEEGGDEENEESSLLRELLRAFSAYRETTGNTISEDQFKKMMEIPERKEPNRGEKEEAEARYERHVLEWMVQNNRESVDGLSDPQQRRDCRDKLLEVTREFFLNQLFTQLRQEQGVQIRDQRESNDELQHRQLESIVPGTQILDMMMVPLDRGKVEKQEEAVLDKVDAMPLLSDEHEPFGDEASLLSFTSLEDVLNFIKMFPSGSASQARNRVALKQKVLLFISGQEISPGMCALVSGILKHPGTLIEMNRQDLEDLVLAALLETKQLSATPGDEEISTRLSRIMGLGKSLMGKGMRPCSSALFEVCEEIPDVPIGKTIYLQKNDSGGIISATVLIPCPSSGTIRCLIDLADLEANENDVEQYRPMIVQKIMDKLLEDEKRLKEMGMTTSMDTLLSMEYNDHDEHSKGYFHPMIEIYQRAFNDIVPLVNLSHQSLILNLADEARNLNVTGQKKPEIEKKQSSLEKVKKAGVVILEDIGRNETTKCTVLQSILRMASVVYDGKNPERTKHQANIDALAQQAQHREWQKDNGLRRVALAIAGALTLFIGTAVTLFFKHKQETRHAFSTAIQEVGLNAGLGAGG